MLGLGIDGLAIAGRGVSARQLFAALGTSTPGLWIQPSVTRFNAESVIDTIFHRR